MRWIERLSVVFVVLAAVLAGVTYYSQQKTKDDVPPVIEMESDRIDVSIAATESEYLAGITATDDQAGDVTDSLLVESISNFMANDEREISVVAFDQKGNVSKATRIIHYIDYTPTRFSLKEPLRFAVGTSSTVLLSNLTAEDCLDGNATSWVVMETASGSPLSTGTAGTYPVVISVTNTAGAVEKLPATLEIFDSVLESTLPRITLTEAMVYLNQGDSFDPAAYWDSLIVDSTSYVWQDGLFWDAAYLTKMAQGADDADNRGAEDSEPLNTESYWIDSPVDTNVPGWYEVTYTAQDSLGNTKSARLLVRVLERNQ